MTATNLLQNRINELNSAIVNFTDKKVRVTGFYNEKMLTLHLEQHKENYSSIGLYDNDDVTFSTIQHDALFIIQKNGRTTEKYKFTVLFRDTVQRVKDKGFSIITIRKNNFADQWQVTTKDDFLEFTTHESLISHLEESYKFKGDYPSFFIA